MMVFFKKRDRLSLENEKWAKKLRKCDDERQFYESWVRTLLLFIKDFSLDIKELDTGRFKEGIDRLAEKVRLRKKRKKLKPIFEKEKENIISYIDRQKKHLHDRETELKDIINLLAKALAAVNAESEDFNQKMYEQSEKIEKITLLDDIKLIKTALTQEIEQMRETVREKQSKEAKQIESLSEQVSTLKSELEKTKAESVRDELTGAYNVQAFDRYIKNTVEKNAVMHSPFSMFVLDIDDYDKIEDTYGQNISERVILAIAQECWKFTRSDDFFARYRKGTFIIVLPGESLRRVSKKARQLCKSIATNRYYVDDALHGHRLSFTVSIGVSTYRRGDSVATVTSRAVKALYAARRSGKNRVATEKVRFLLFKRDEVETIEQL